MSALLHEFSDWYLSALSQGGYWLIAGLMALESTVVPIPSETIIPPAAYLAHTRGGLSLVGVVLSGTAGSWVGAALMYMAARWLGRPFVMRFGRYVALPPSKIESTEPSFWKRSVKNRIVSSYMSPRRSLNVGKWRSDFSSSVSNP